MKNILAVALVLVPLAVAQQKDSGLPEGPGKKQVEKICTKCHDTEGFSHSRNSRQRWESVVDDMVSRGAEGTDAEIELIIEYLSTYLGRLNLNKATAEKLAEGLAIPKEVAEAIVSHREKNGPYKVFDDLSKVQGIDMKKIETKKGIVEF